MHDEDGENHPIEQAQLEPIEEGQPVVEEMPVGGLNA